MFLPELSSNTGQASCVAPFFEYALTRELKTYTSNEFPHFMAWARTYSREETVTHAKVRVGASRWWALGWNRRVTCDWSKTLSWGCSRRRWAKTTISAGIKDGIVHTMWIGEAWIASDNNSGSSVGRVSDNDERAPSSRGLPWNCDIGTMSVKTKSVMEQSSGGAISNYKTTSEFSR